MKNNIAENIKKQATWLPVFSGFYGSYFEPSDDYIERETSLSENEYKEYYSECYKAGVTKEFFDSNLWDCLDNYNEALSAVAESICDAILELDSSDIIKGVEFEKLVSPTYYNFSNDSINCTIEYDSEKLKSFINEHRQEFEKYLKRKYTSRDGFSSYYSNRLEDWMSELNDLGSHELGSILNFVFEVNYPDNEAEMALYEESNISEAFMNNIEFNSSKMIQDFKEHLQEKSEAI